MDRSRKIALSIIIPLCLVLAVTAIALFPYFYNNSIMRSMSRYLNGEMTRLSDVGGGDVIVVEQKNACGRLSGNGNGMQFFSAVMLHAASDVRLDILDQALDALQLEFEDANAVELDGDTLDLSYLEHANITFDHFGEDDMGKYIVVYIFDSRSGSDLDVRAH